MKRMNYFNGLGFRITALMTIFIFMIMFLSFHQSHNLYQVIHDKENTNYENYIDNILKETKEVRLKRKFINYKRLRDIIALSFVYAKDNKVLQKQIVTASVKTEGVISYQILNNNDEILLSLYKKDNKIIDSNNIPPSLIENADIFIDERLEHNLKFRIYYNMSKLTESIDDTYDMYGQDFDFLLEDVSNEREIIEQADAERVWFNMILVLIILFFIIKIMIKNPITKINNQINSFFAKLKNQDFKIDNINLKSKNELGVIAKFLDDNLQHILTRNKELRLERYDTDATIQNSKLIQQALIPNNTIFNDCFREYFVYFKSKNMIGGDMYFFNEVRKNEFLLMCIDCTGHNIAGAFVAMSVAIVQNSIIEDLQHSSLDISPADILGKFNTKIKHLFDDKGLEVGFDGGIIHVNKNEDVIAYAGANIPLYYSDNYRTIKSLPYDKYSVGYHKCDLNYKYSNYELKIKNDTSLYISTDGFIDQVGGDMDLRFGKKRFIKMIENSLSKSYEEQKEIYHQELESYKNTNKQTDDIAFIAMMYKKSQSNTKKDDILYAEHKGKFSQNNVTEIVSEVEKKMEINKINMNISKKISISIIEIAQNISKYSKNTFNKKHAPYPDSISIKENNKNYTISSSNVIDKQDKKVISNILDNIKTLTKQELKEHYHYLRRSGNTFHNKGAGIGFYQISTKSDTIDYGMHKINEDEFVMDLTISIT